MQKTFIILALIFSIAAIAQQGQKQTQPPVRSNTMPLPMKIYNTLRDSCTQLDIVFITGKGGSMSMDNNRSIRGFTSFITPRAAVKKPNAQQDGTIMWQIDGKAYLMANLYLTGDSSGYVTFDKDSKEYVNAISPDGAGFLKTRGGK